MLLVYPEGNYIHVSDDRPFVQIGESKYGKSMLELAVHARVDIETAIKVALSSMISTAHSNLEPPSDVVVEVELPGVGAQAQGVDLGGALVADPGVDEVVGEDVAGPQEVPVGLEGVEGGLE